MSNSSYSFIGKKGGIKKSLRLRIFIKKEKIQLPLKEKGGGLYIFVVGEEPGKREKRRRRSSCYTSWGKEGGQKCL